MNTDFTQSAATAAYSEYLGVAHELADEASRLLRAWFGRARADRKGDGSYVTQADLEVDRFIHEAIAARFPSHGQVSEEISGHYDGAEFTWVVDPLDGTDNFAAGLAYWGPSIALLQHGVPVLGVLDFPLLGLRLSASVGGGATLNSRRLTSHSFDGFHANQLMALDSTAYRLIEVALPSKARVLGSAAYDLIAVAAGMTVAALIITPKVWDLAAAWVVDQEAGVTIAPLFDGDPIFPLQPGFDYADLNCPLLAAPDPTAWQTIRASTRLRPGAEAMTSLLARQGWQLPAF